jgi:hypothetical protein
MDRLPALLGLPRKHLHLGHLPRVARLPHKVLRHIRRLRTRGRGACNRIGQYANKSLFANQRGRHAPRHLPMTRYWIAFYGVAFTEINELCSRQALSRIESPHRRCSAKTKPIEQFPKRLKIPKTEIPRLNSAAFRLALTYALGLLGGARQWVFAHRPRLGVVVRGLDVEVQQVLGSVFADTVDFRGGIEASVEWIPA